MALSFRRISGLFYPTLTPCYERIVDSYSIELTDEGYKCEQSLPSDDIGHGSAVATIIYNQNPQVDFISIRIRDDSNEYNENAIICALKYVYSMNVDMVNISAGITYLANAKEMVDVCKKIADKGVIIVSAFDNDGAISYPAACPDVIGVDVTRNYENREEIVFQENSIVDLVVADRFYRTLWNSEKTIMRGTSFAAAYITGIISKIICKNGIMSKENIIDAIATKKRQVSSCIPLRKMPFVIKKAIIFPLNKESTALLKFRDEAEFEIAGIYDSRLSGNVGKTYEGLEIRNFDEIDWKEDFDTVIVSCCTELSRLTKRDYQLEISEYASKYNKNIVTFENWNKRYAENIYYPEVMLEELPKFNVGKMHKICAPVVGVFGTSSKQGKYTLQLEIKKRIQKKGYRIGFLATEPSGCLLGADYTFHFGYHAYFDKNPKEMISILNQMMWEIQNKGSDLIITGCQSGSIHYDDSTIDSFAIYQYAYMLGISPDYNILCVNPQDDIEYIDRTINFLNSVNNCKVEAIVVFPVETTEIGGFNYKNVKRILDPDSMKMLKESYRERYLVNAYALDNSDDLDDLVYRVLDYFAEE